MSKARKVFQLRISLEGIEPEIWRRIQIPSASTFWDLHCAIQDSFGWQDCHLHEFRLGRGKTEVRIGIFEEDDDELLPGWDETLEEHIRARKTFTYVYDFGDNWVHSVTLEKVADAVPRKKYPLCLEGQRACPPEDCGGPYRYPEFLEAIRNPKHPEHKEMLEWIGEPFDPERFDAKDVRFSDPEERLAMVMGEG